MKRSVYLRLQLWKHKAWRFCSKSYREHDAVVSDREKWRRESIVTGNKVAQMHDAARDLEAEAAQLRERLKLAIEAQQKAAEQVLVERALRQSADERANRYHEELTEALKRSADWACVGRRVPMYGTVAEREEPAAPTTSMPTKPMARGMAQKQTHETLQGMLNDMRNGEAALPVGPEFQ